MQAEIITIGTELLLGKIVDTNSAYLAQRLAEVGLNLFYTTTVGDNEERIVLALREALGRSDVVITTGGLGPTVDDITRAAVAKATGRELLLDADLLALIEAFFHSRGRQMSDVNRVQAYIPAGAIPIPNPVGTAPAYVVEQEDACVISLPGVPHEMRFLTENRVVPYLRQKYDLAGVIKSRTLRTCGIGESQVGSQIADLMRGGNPTVGTAAHPGQTDVRISVKAGSDADADALIEPVEREIRKRLGIHVFGADEQALEQAVLDALSHRGQTLAIAEGGTTSLVSERIVRWPGAAQVLHAATVFPDPSTLLRAYPLDYESADRSSQQSELSEGAALRIAQAVRYRYGAHWGLALLGPGAPEPAEAHESDTSVYLALAGEDRETTDTLHFGRQTPSVIGWMVCTALDMLRRALLEPS